jgi:hypothetical protein
VNAWSALSRGTSAASSSSLPPRTSASVSSSSDRGLQPRGEKRLDAGRHHVRIDPAHVEPHQADRGQRAHRRRRRRIDRGEDVPQRGEPVDRGDDVLVQASRALHLQHHPIPCDRQEVEAQQQSRRDLRYAGWCGATRSRSTSVKASSSARAQKRAATPAARPGRR